MSAIVEVQGLRTVWPRRNVWAVIASAALLASSCGGSASDAGPATSAEPTTTQVATTEPPTTSTTELATTTTTSPAPGVSSANIVAPPDAGEPLDYGPAVGTALAIVGLEANTDLGSDTENADDPAILTPATLDFFVAPGEDQAIERSEPAFGSDAELLAAGNAWAFPDSVWWQLTIDGVEVWADQANLGALGDSFNVYDEVFESLDGVEAPTLNELALRIAQSRPTGGPEPRITIVTEETEIDAPHHLYVIVDILGLGDDAVKGERLRIEVLVIFEDTEAADALDDESADAPDETVEDERTVLSVILSDVILTPICGRGVHDGLCL